MSLQQNTLRYQFTRPKPYDETVDYEAVDDEAVDENCVVVGCIEQNEALLTYLLPRLVPAYVRIDCFISLFFINSKIAECQKSISFF